MARLLTINEPLTINGLQVTIEDAAKFAPVVRFHAKEQYFPCSIEFLLAGSTLVVGTAETLQPTFEDLYAARNAPAAHLRIDPSAWHGMPPQNNLIPAPMYVAPQVAPDKSFVDFTYYFLSAFNGPQAVWVNVAGGIPLDSFNCAIEQFAFHQGDVESITVRVTPDLTKVIHVGMSAHGDYTYYLPDELAFETVTHPLVNCAVFSHASYNSLDTSHFIHPGDRTEYKVLLDIFDLAWEGFNAGRLNFMDDISWGNVTWQPFSLNGGRTTPNGQLVFIGFDGSIDNPINGQTWASFQGDLGQTRNNHYADVIPIRESLDDAQKLAFAVGGPLAQAVGAIPEEYKIGNGPDGFGNPSRRDRMMIAAPVDLLEQSVIVSSRLSPVFALGVDPNNPTGDVTLRPLTLGVPPAFYHHWTQVSYGPGTSPIVLINNGSGMAMGVLAGSGAGTDVGQMPSNHLGVGAKWNVLGGENDSSPVSLQAIYNRELFIGAHTPNFWGPAVSLEKETGQIERDAQWGIVPIIPGQSMLALVSMYRSSHDDTLWWSAFDPVSLAWMPDAPIGQGMSAASGPALAMLSGQIFAVYRGTDSQLWWTAYDPDNRQWMKNQPFGQGMKTSATPALAVLGNTLYCVHRGFDDDGLWWTMFDVPSGKWIKDRAFGQGIAAQSGPAIAALNGVLYCVHRGNDNGLWWTSFAAATGTWQKDRSFGLGAKTQGAALSVLNGTLYCAYRGMDQQLWWTVFVPSLGSWKPSQAFGQGMSTSTAPSLAVFDGWLYCVYKAKDGQHLWWTRFTHTTDTWSDNQQFNFDIRTQDVPAVVSAV